MNQKPKRYIWPVGSSETGYADSAAVYRLQSGRMSALFPSHNGWQMKMSQIFHDLHVTHWASAGCSGLVHATACGEIWQLLTAAEEKWDNIPQATINNTTNSIWKGEFCGYLRLKDARLYPQISREVPENSISADGRCFDFSFCERKKWSWTAFGFVSIVSHSVQKAWWPTY